MLASQWECRDDTPANLSQFRSSDDKQQLPNSTRSALRSSHEKRHQRYGARLDPDVPPPNTTKDACPLASELERV